MSSIVITAEFQFVQIDLACAGKVGKIPKGVAGVSGGIRRFGNRLRRFRLGLRRVAVLLRRCFAERGHDAVLDLLNGVLRFGFLLRQLHRGLGQLIQGFNRGDRIYALVAPAFINQFPSLASTGKLKSALKAIGFCDVVEVAIGADLCTVDEAHDFLEEVPEKLDFMATSCCPAWSMMAKTAFPGLAKNISMTMTPMVFTARMMKQADPDARMCFIGPCAAKKLEASRRTVRSDVDFVLTFEELAGIIEAKDLDLDNLEVDPAEMDLCYASAAGRGFAQSGGVAKAVADKIKEWRPDMEVKIASAQGLADCKKLLMLAKAGKYNGYLLEGMGCPGGCIGGAGTIADPVRTAAVLNKYVKDAEFTDPEQSAFMSNIHMLKDDPNFEV